jgi:VCBS repeat-containing protein
MSNPLTLISDDDGKPVIIEGNGPVSVVMDEDASPTAFALTLNAFDGNDDTLTWSITAGPAHGNATGVGTGASKAITYAPTVDWHGSDSFTVQVSDGVLTDSVNVNVTVNPRNDAPVNTRVPSVSGTLLAGATLTVDRGDWNDIKDTVPGALTYAYQWQQANDVGGTATTDISDASAATYTVRAGNAAKAIRVRITCADNGQGLPATQSTVAVSSWQMISGNNNDGSSDNGKSCGMGSFVSLAGAFLLLVLSCLFRRPIG